MEESHNLGYDHRYEFWLDEDIIPRFKYKRLVGVRKFLFEFRTSFIVRPIEEEDKIIGSEILHAHVKETSHEADLQYFIAGRLRDYWLSTAGMYRFIEAAMSFAREKASHEPRRDVIPVVVDFDVCTVQQLGEDLCAAEDRAIRPEHMVPIYVSSIPAFCGVKPRITLFLLSYLSSKRRIRVKDVDEGLSLMDECRICGRMPTLGAQISHLKCGHAFHSHCVVSWLQESANCPVCGAKESPVCGRRTGRDFFVRF